MLKIDRSSSEESIVRFADLKRGELFTIDGCRIGSGTAELFVFMKAYHASWTNSGNNVLNAICIDDGEMIFVADDSKVNRVEAKMTITKGKVKG